MPDIIVTQVPTVDAGSPGTPDCSFSPKPATDTLTAPRLPNDTARFLVALFATSKGKLCFQTFPDRDEDRKDELRKRALTSQYHDWPCDGKGFLNNIGSELLRLNSELAGVFLTVNGTDGHRRTNESISLLRAVFIDHDEMKDGPMKAGIALPASIIVRTANGRHYYWLLKIDQPLNRFTACQKHLIQFYGTDKAVNDLARVMRVPGFMHNKGMPTLVTLEHCDHTLTYTMDEILSAHPLPASGVKMPHGTAQGRPALGFGGSPASDFNKVMEGCAVMRHLRDNPTKIDYGLWFDCINIAAHCADGPRHAHELSSLDTARYHQETTQQKIDDTLKAGPCLCTTLSDAGGEPMCKVCPYFGKISTPIELGREPTKPSAKEVLAEHDRKVEADYEVAQKKAEEDAAVLLACMRTTPATLEVFSRASISMLARLPLGLFAGFKAELKEAFDKASKELNLNDLTQAVNSERQDQSFKQKKARGIIEAAVNQEQEEAEMADAATYDDRGLTFIPTKNRPMREMTSDAIDCLEADNKPPKLFRHGHQLAEIRDEATGSKYIEQVTSAMLRSRMDRSANWVVYKPARDKKTGKLKKSPTAVHPPESVVQDLMAQGNLPFPRLEGIIYAPILRSDGSVLTETGYDKSTGLYLVAIHRMAMTIPESPTPEMRNAARVAVLDVIQEFPFIDQASRANAIAMALTMVVMPAIKGNIPAVLIDTPAEGSGTGKTLLVRALTMLATHAEPNILSVPRNPDEYPKSISALLSGGHRVAVFDNLPNDAVVDSGDLAALLTTRVWSTRVFGENDRTLSLPNNTLWVLTGNGPRLGGDLERRFFTIRMDTGSENPAARKGFKHNPLMKYVSEQRHMLLLSLLILARAWFVAGKPRNPNAITLGSFDEWVEVVGGILHHAGIDGFLQNHGSQLARSQGAAVQITEFLKVWHLTLGDKPSTCATIRQNLIQNQSFADALPSKLIRSFADDPPTNFNRKLGELLRSRKDRSYGGLTLNGSVDRTGLMEWVVRKVLDSAAGSAGSAGSESG